MREIEIFKLEAEQPLWRVHHIQYSANQFNNSEHGNGRFNPLLMKTSYHGESKILPTLYAANQYHEAFAETLMRKDNSYKVLSEQTLANLQLSVITPQTTVTLADLDGQWVPPIIKEAVHLPQSYGIYPLLREFAIRLVNLAPDIQGLKWQSVQRNLKGQSVYVFINHHKLKHPTEFKISNYNASLLSPNASSKLRECANLFDYILPGDYF